MDHKQRASPPVRPSGAWTACWFRPCRSRQPGNARSSQRARCRVLLTRRPTEYKGPFVGTDNIPNCTRLAMRHLGRNWDTTISRMSRRCSRWRQRYRAASRLSHRTCRCRFVVSAPQTIEGGRMIVADLLRGKAPPTSSSRNDLQAIGVMLGLCAAGVRVPGISVIGFVRDRYRRDHVSATDDRGAADGRIGRLGAADRHAGTNGGEAGQRVSGEVDSPRFDRTRSLTAASASLPDRHHTVPFHVTMPTGMDQRRGIAILDHRRTRTDASLDAALSDRRSHIGEARRCRQTFRLVCAALRH